MMNLDQQIQALIDSAPQDGTTPAMMAAVAPVIRSIAEQLRYPEYYVLQTLDHGWVMTTLSNRHQPTVEKNVVYAYPTLNDARTGSKNLNDPQITALPVPVTHMLFHMLAMKSLDSIVFFETGGNLQNGTEVAREKLQELIKLFMQNQRRKAQPPPDIA
ncbi:MAG: hypothetical protein VKK04_02470 [Synechococcales bacterium]|nr:hypothetical protein [Synechococcales bacterium]